MFEIIMAIVNSVIDLIGTLVLCTFGIVACTCIIESYQNQK